ncbi:ULP-protease domain-containing protein [Favolaschia claudopus]|uniref:ULP-protease domain-containing protein n=1 Tax=Favolaschia claudopus TaxID=2862362 RepID=A0AAV9ZSM2_9AGAR
MLELSASDLGISDGSTSCVQSTYFVHALAQAYEDPATYRAASRFAWLRRLGIAFATKQRLRLGTIVNEDENHWTALTIDCEAKHLGAKFKWIDIPVAKQNDPCSCGILYFALAHWFDPARFSLPTFTTASMAEERRNMFLRIIQRHRRKTGNFADDARDYDFTFRQVFGISRRVLELEEDEDGLELEDYIEKDEDSPQSDADSTGPGKLHQRVVRKKWFLRPKFDDFLVRKSGF